MKRCYILINQVKVELVGCRVLESIGVFDTRFQIDLSLPFNKNDESVDKFLKSLWDKRHTGEIHKKSEIVFDAKVFEGEDCVGEFLNIQPLYRDGQFIWHLIFDVYAKRKRIYGKPGKDNYVGWIEQSQCIEPSIQNPINKCPVACKVKKCFWLDEDEVAKLKKWQDEIKKKNGEYGNYTYMFSSGGGIGTVIKVKSELTGGILDLTDVGKW